MKSQLNHATVWPTDARVRRRISAGPRTAFALALVLVVAGGCHRKDAATPTPDEAPAGPISLGPRDVAQVTSERVLAGVKVVGTLSPAVMVDLKARLAEEIETIHADRGTVVTQGQVLARLDNRGPLAQLNSAQSQLSAAERDFTAAETLFKGGAISERSLANARVNRDAAKTQLDEATQNLDHATVKSPVDGVVSDRAVSVGEAVSPGQVLFSVVNSENLECTVSVLPADVVNVRVGQRALLSLFAYGGLELEGRVARIDPLADAQSRRVGVHIRIPNADQRVVAGLFCTGTVVTNDASLDRSVLLVPAAAVLAEEGTQVVYSVREGRLRRSEVDLETDPNADGFVEVRSGLTVGETVVLSPTARLKDGLPVRLSAPGGQP